MSSVDVDGGRTSSPNSRQSLVHLALFTSLLVPLACIPYIPIRRHLLGLKKSINALSNNTLSLQQELNSTMLQARLLREEKLQLASQLHDLRDQLYAVREQTSKFDSDVLLNNRMVRERFDAIEELSAVREDSNQRVGEELGRQVDFLRKRVDRNRLPDEFLLDISTALADVASFIEEVELQQGWFQSIPRDRGIDRIRQLALKLHTSAKTKPSTDRDTQ